MNQTKPVLPQEEPLRLRPRDGEARCMVESVAQFAWRWRIEAALAYLVVAVSLAALAYLGVL